MVEKPTVNEDVESNEATGKVESSRVKQPRDQIPENTSYSSYLFGRAGESDKPLWSDTTKGRATIRLVSRGIVGAFAMTAVDRISRAQLQNYRPEDISSWTQWGQANLSQKIAKGYDTVFGKPIQWFVHGIAPGGANSSLKKMYAENAVTFRPKNYFHTNPGYMPGHSLGAEIVQVTASFAAGSLGDAGTRNIIQSLDPNNGKTYMLNDKGEIAKPGEKKHFDFDRWAKSTLRTTWRVLSKNMGEDWAVALPYVYQMRWQRNLLAAHHFPDSKLTFDKGYNGGSTHIDRTGKIMGDFQLPGAIDLHARFVGYNWLTLMYRETYDAVGRQMQKWQEHGFSIKPHLPTNPIASTVDTVGYGARYVAKSFIKANLYMNPAVVPFWVMRVSQSKWRAAPIVQNQDEKLNGLLLTSENGQKVVRQDKFGNWRHMYDAAETSLAQTSNVADCIVDGHSMMKTPELLKNSGPYSMKMAGELCKAHLGKGLFSTLLMPFGWASYKIGGAAESLGNYLPQGGRIGNLLDTGAGTGGRTARQTFMHEFSDNALSYTPYMIAKAETALRVDERPADGGLGAMDKAIYKFIDSTVRFDFKRSGEALRDIKSNALDMGREVKMREGGEVPIAAPTPILTPDDKPTRVVHAKSVARDPGTRERASDKDGDAPQADKNWAESVTGQALDGRFQSGPHSIH